MPVRLLRELTPTRGVRDSAEQRLFRFSVGRWYSRYPFPDDLNPALKRFLVSVKEKHGNEFSAQGQVFDLLKQARVRARPGWEADRFSVTLIFLVSGMEAIEPHQYHEETAQWVKGASTTQIAERILIETAAEALWPLWEGIAESWASMCVAVGKIEDIDSEVVDESAFGQDRVGDSERLDLGYLSGADQSAVE